jgi:phage/plasmid-like protein (TIGR03299 family)
VVAAVETMMYVKSEGTPWHGLGTAVDEAPNLREAAKLAGLEWLVEKHPLYVQLNVDGKRTTKRVTGKFATVRVTDFEILGIVDEQYGVLQNGEVVQILEEAVRDLGVELKATTAGSLRGGKEIFIAARVPKDLVIGDGDVSFPYLLARTGHDGGTSLDIFPTATRVVCWNTLNLALQLREYNGGYRGVSLWHTGDIDSKVKQVKDSLKFSLKELDVYADKANALADVPVTDAIVDEFIRIVIPPIALLPAPRTSVALLPAPDPNRWVTAVPADAFERAKEKREQKVEIFRKVYAEEKANAYGLWNAATGYADHQRPYAWQKAEARFQTTMFGEGARIKARAWDGILELAGIQ